MAQRASRSDIEYSDWQPLGAAPTGGAPALKQRGTLTTFISGPQDDYKLEIQILKLTVNEEISADRFELAQPAGAELVRVGEEQAGAQP